MSFFSHLFHNPLPPSPFQSNGLPNVPGAPGFSAGYTGLPGIGGNNPPHARINPIMGTGGFDPTMHYNRLAGAMYGMGNQGGFGSRLAGMGGFGPRMERF